MSSLDHSTLELATMHRAHNWEFADSTARLAYTAIPDDLFKLALQLDDFSLWILTDDSPETWLQASAGLGGAVSSVNTQTGVVVLDADDIDDTSTTNKFTTATEITKLSGIEALADVTDATNVDTAGAVMNSDSSTAGMSFVIDEDSFVTDSNTKVPTQQSTKAYVDAQVAGGTPDASDTVKGKVELATTAETTTGTDATRAVTPDGLHDMTSLAGAAWFLDEDSFTSNSDTKVPSQQSVKAYVDSSFGSVPSASDTVAGKVELATTAETTTGTDATRAVTPDGLHDMTSLSGAAWFLDEDTMTSNSDTKVPSQQSVKAYVVSLTTLYSTINIVIDGGGVVIAANTNIDFIVDFAHTIISATALADLSGSIVVDIWRDSYANYPPVDADSITASAPVTISSALKSQDSTLTGWSTSGTAGQTYRINVDSATTIKRCLVSLKILRT